MDAFYELSSCRVNSMVVGSIPFTAIVEYSRLFEVGDFEEFHYIIRLMDNTYLDLQTKKSKTQVGAKSGTTATGKTNKNNRGHKG